MFTRERRSRYAIVAVLAFGALHAVPVSAADGFAICASGAGPRAPVPVPKDLEADVARTFDLRVDLVRHIAFVRCVGDRLMACSVGANLTAAR